jgi:hypothetical protein
LKVVTLALGALVATSAAVYLTAGDNNDEADLVADRPGGRVVTAPAVVPTQIPAQIPAQSNNSEAITKTDAAKIGAATVDETYGELVAKERDPEASRAKANLFRALESPPVVAAPVVAPVEVAPRPPVVTPNPTFIFLGSFREGAELNAILQVGEKIEFVKASEIVAGFRVDSVDSGTLSWTHEQTATKGQLRARLAK